MNGLKPLKLILNPPIKMGDKIRILELSPSHAGDTRNLSEAICEVTTRINENVYELSRLDHNESCVILLDRNYKGDKYVKICQV
jgi:hypothetical protein